ncbi:MAG TPA: hypothetical protein VF552_16830 [Allosphingosinicella sp.]
MKPESVRILAEPAEIHEYVLSLWSDGPIRRSHEEGGSVARLVDRFARTPRFFYEASEPAIEWTHFSTWWGAILLADYDNPAVRDLRYLHEISHGASMPYVAACNLPTFEAKMFRNEREASTYTEMAIYLDFPELRPLTFSHPIFMDRFLFPGGNYEAPDARLLERWKSEPDLVFQELMYERARVIWAGEEEIDRQDPQIVWLRRYGEQGDAWVRVWAERYRLVEERMIGLREESRAGDRAGAAARHLDWLLSSDIAGGSDVPFRREAEAFKASFDRLIETYDRAMAQAAQVPVKSGALSGAQEDMD